MTSDRLIYGFDAEPLSICQTHIPGESLLSWVARSSLEYELPNITTILRDVGQIHRNCAVDVMRGAIDVEGLAVILGTNLGQIERLRGRDLGDGSLVYLGSKIRCGDIHARARRFAPRSLALGETPFSRASWLIRTFPVCTESWQALRSKCECGATLPWATVSTMLLCENCGSDLREIPGETLEPELRNGLRFLANILFGENPERADAIAKLPDDLQLLDPGEIYELALVIARVVDPTMDNPREKVWRDEPMRLARALARAGELLPRWPETPWLALDVYGSAKKMLPRCDALKTLFKVLNNELGSSLPLSITNKLRHMRDDLDLGSEPTHKTLVDIDQAEKILRVGKIKIRAARRAGHLKSRFLIRRNEILLGFERGELEEIAATLDWPAAVRAGRLLGLPSYGLEQMCAMTALEWAKAPRRTLRSCLRIDPTSVAQLELSLINSSVDLEMCDEPVPLGIVMRGIGGREKPWGPVIVALAEGRWPFSISRKGKLIRTIAVPREHVAEIRSLSFDRSNWPTFPFDEKINQEDACDILNVPLRERGRVMKHRTGRSRSWILDRESVVDLARGIVTSAELGARHFLAPKTCHARIQEVELDPVDLGYVRSTSMQKFDDHIVT